MNNSINLIGNQQKSKFRPFLKRIKILRFVAIVLLFGISACSVILFILISISPLPKLKEQEKELLANMVSYHGDMAKLQVVQERSNLIGKVIAQRLPYDAVIALIKNKISNGVTITGITIEKKLVTVSVSSKSLQPLNEFLNSGVKSVEDGKDFSSVSLESFTINDETNDYILSVKFVLL